MSEIKTVPLAIVVTICLGIIGTASGWIAFARALPEHSMMVVAARAAVEARAIAEVADRKAGLNERDISNIANEVREGFRKLEARLDKMVEGR